MPIPWLTILKNVPWSTVIDTAPTVADGAKKLWKTVSTRAQSHEDGGDVATESPAAAQQARSADEDVAPRTADGAALRAVEALDTKLAALQGDVAELEHQLLASTELINTLADQNALLIQRVEANRIRTVWLTRASIALAIAAALGLGGLAFTLLR